MPLRSVRLPLPRSRSRCSCRPPSSARGVTPGEVLAAGIDAPGVMLRDYAYGTWPDPPRVADALPRLQYHCPRSQWVHRQNIRAHVWCAHTTNRSESTRPCHRRPVEWTRSRTHATTAPAARVPASQPEGSEVNAPGPHSVGLLAGAHSTATPPTEKAGSPQAHDVRSRFPPFLRSIDRRDASGWRLRRRDIRRHSKRNPSRCQRRMVSG